MTKVSNDEVFPKNYQQKADALCEANTAICSPGQLYFNESVASQKEEGFYGIIITADFSTSCSLTKETKTSSPKGNDAHLRTSIFK